MKTLISWLIDLAFIFGATAFVAWVLTPQIPFAFAWKIAIAIWLLMDWHDIKPTWKKEEKK